MYASPLWELCTSKAANASSSTAAQANTADKAVGASTLCELTVRNHPTLPFVVEISPPLVTTPAALAVMLARSGARAATDSCVLCVVGGNRSRVSSSFLWLFFFRTAETECLRVTNTQTAALLNRRCSTCCTQCRRLSAHVRQHRYRPYWLTYRRLQRARLHFGIGERVCDFYYVHTTHTHTLSHPRYIDTSTLAPALLLARLPCARADSVVSAIPLLQQQAAWAELYRSCFSCPYLTHTLDLSSAQSSAGGITSALSSSSSSAAAVSFTFVPSVSTSSSSSSCSSSSVQPSSASCAHGGTAASLTVEVTSEPPHSLQLLFLHPVSNAMVGIRVLVGEGASLSATFHAPGAATSAVRLSDEYLTSVVRASHSVPLLLRAVLAPWS